MGKHLDPAAEERRKQKQREIRKGKEQKQQQKLERLKTLNPQRLQRRIEDLEQKKEKNGGKLGHEERMLLSLKKDLETVRKLRGEDTEDKPEPEVVNREQDVTVLGNKSIFYHPEWNPKGLAPLGLANVEQSGFGNTEAEPLDIPLPSSPPPKFYKIQVDVIEKDAEVKRQVFVPSSIQRKRKLGQ